MAEAKESDMDGENPMTRFKLIRTRNALLFSNLISNIIGVSVVTFLTSDSSSQIPEEIFRLVRVPYTIFMFLAFSVPFALTIYYERPIRRYLGKIYAGEAVPEALALKARRKLLNEPFFLIALDLAVWFSAATFFPLMFRVLDAGTDVIWQAFSANIYTGLITTTVAFFVFEFVLQRRVIPVFFPEGGLHKMTGTIRIHIRTRMIALLFACNLIPLISILLELYHPPESHADPSASPARFTVRSHQPGAGLYGGGHLAQFSCQQQPHPAASTDPPGLEACAQGGFRRKGDRNVQR